MRVGGTISAYKTCGHTATVLRQPCWPLTWHRYSARWPDRTTPYRWLRAMWQSNGTGRPHAVEDIINLLLALNALAAVIGIQLPWGHQSGPGSQCNCPTLSYKRTGQTTDSNKALLGKFNPRLEPHTQQYNNPLYGYRVLCFSGSNHVNHRVHLAWASRALVPLINEPPWATLVVVPEKVS
jgi:hypothetical protein